MVLQRQALIFAVLVCATHIFGSPLGCIESKCTAELTSCAEDKNSQGLLSCLYKNSGSVEIRVGPIHEGPITIPAVDVPVPFIAACAYPYVKIDVTIPDIGRSVAVGGANKTSGAIDELAQCAYDNLESCVTDDAEDFFSKVISPLTKDALSADNTNILQDLSGTITNAASGLLLKGRAGLVSKPGASSSSTRLVSKPGASSSSERRRLRGSARRLLGIARRLGSARYSASGKYWMKQAPGGGVSTTYMCYQDKEGGTGIDDDGGTVSDSVATGVCTSLSTDGSSKMSYYTGGQEKESCCDDVAQVQENAQVGLSTAYNASTGQYTRTLYGKTDDSFDVLGHSVATFKADIDVNLSQLTSDPKSLFTLSFIHTDFHACFLGLCIGSGANVAQPGIVGLLAAVLSLHLA